jgi:hypothetical protein
MDGNDMKQANILYEPTPISRLGFSADHPELPVCARTVLISQDFSCFAYMLQEYISYGIVSILMPSSLPEASATDQMPSMLRERVRIVSDAAEIEAVGRLLLPIRRTFEVEFEEGSGQLKFTKQFPRDLRKKILEVHQDLKRLAFGFNHSVAVEIDPTRFLDNLYGVRQHTSDPVGRSVLAQLEGLLRYYDTVVFYAQVPSDQTPFSLVTLFDSLINNTRYIEYSELIAGLSVPSTRTRALAKLRELSLFVKSKQMFATGWDYTTKILKVWTGLPLPESKELGSLMTSRTLPPVVNMNKAHERAVEAWRVFGAANKPLHREGSFVDVHWLPPLPSMRLSGEDTILGTVGQLLDQLQSMIDKDAGSQV